MDIRCPSCSKLFRVADEKIAGKGIRFKCSKCAEVITITKDDFEMDLLAREDEPAAPAAQPSVSTLKPVPATPPSPPAPEPREYKPQEYQPPAGQSADEQPGEDQQIPPASLGDFDFSEPHVAAASASHPAEGFGGHDFSFDASQEQAAPEIEISPEAAADAEAALDFPVDLISEPQRKPAFEVPAREQQEKTSGPGPISAPELQPDDEPAPEPQRKPQAAAPREEPPRTGPLFTPPSRTTTAPSPRASADEEIDLGAALSVPQTASSGTGASEEPPGKASLSPGMGAETEWRGQEDIHPFAAGNVTGAIAGLGCALSIVALLVLSFGMVMKLFPFFAGLSLYKLAALAGSGIVSMSVLIGIVISIVQAQAGKKLFFLANVLIGLLFGAALGVGAYAAMALVTRADLSLPAIVDHAVSSAIIAFVLSILVVAARRLVVHAKDESFSADLSLLQKMGLGMSLIVLLFAVYESGSFTAKRAQAMREPRRTFPAAGKQEPITPAGLQVVNAHGYFDPATRDLVITGSLRNTLDRPKTGWYLVTEVRDAKENVLATVRTVNGAQLYSNKEYEVLSKRGANIEDLKRKAATAAGKGEIAARGSVDFEVRLVNPPAGSAGFLPTLQTLDPASLGMQTLKD